jgi:hypothetical protein
MSEISELERRISAALDQIARDVDQLTVAPAQAEDDAVTPAAADVTHLEQALADERLANQQLEERLKALRLKLDKKDVERDLATRDLRAALAEMDGAMSALRQTSQDLRASVEALRAAQGAGTDGAAAINMALAAELAALKAERAAEAAEGQAILAAIDPLVTPASEEVAEEENSPAPENGDVSDAELASEQTAEDAAQPGAAEEQEEV